MTPALAIAVAALAIWLYLLFARGGFWRASPDSPPPTPAHWPEVVAIVPARNEAETVGRAVASLLSQDYPGRLSIILADDHSSDGTASIARRAAAMLGRGTALEVIAAGPLPTGWTGKLWALTQGVERATQGHPSARFVLFTDADIEHAHDSLATLVRRAEAGSLDLVSVMVRLNCTSLAERALMPAFVFFFRMLYPFAWVNRTDRRTAAAAGGCVLLRRTALERIDGLAAIRGRLIDDCALAKAVKAGGRVWLGLSGTTRSLRPYPRFRDIWLLIARTAFNQLRYSPLLLAGTGLGMLLAYAAPPLLAIGATGLPAQIGLLTWIAMTVAYLPSLRAYELTPAWAPVLPLVALFYLGATLDSALRHWTRRGGEWKGRTHRSEAA